MTKSELLSAYTAEQLAEMVVQMENDLKLKVSKSIVLEDGEALKVKCDKCGEEFIAVLDDRYVLCKKEANHKLGIVLPKTSRYCCGVRICIDGERINAIGLYPTDRDGRRLDSVEKMDFESQIWELEVANIEEIAFLMNKETFEKFCELWREYHETEK